MSRNNPNSTSATLIALFGLCITGLALLGLMALVLPDVIWIVVVAGVFAGFLAMHYLVWGHWLTNRLRRNDGVNTAVPVPTSESWNEASDPGPYGAEDGSADQIPVPAAERAGREKSP